MSEQNINPRRSIAPTFDTRDLDLRLWEPQQSPMMHNVQMWQTSEGCAAVSANWCRAEGIIRVSAMHVSNKECICLIR